MMLKQVVDGSRGWRFLLCGLGFLGWMGTEVQSENRFGSGNLAMIDMKKDKSNVFLVDIFHWTDVPCSEDCAFECLNLLHPRVGDEV